MLLSISRDSLEIPIWDGKFLEILHCQIQLFWWRTEEPEIEIFMYFWLIGMMAKLEIKISLVSIKKLSPTLYQAGQFTQGAMSIISWFIKYIYYLSACNRGLFESCYCYVLFLPFEKSVKYYEILLQNPVLPNIRNKCVIRKMNLCFFIFSFSSLSFSIWSRIIFQ